MKLFLLEFHIDSIEPNVTNVPNAEKKSRDWKLQKKVKRLKVKDWTGFKKPESISNEAEIEKITRLEKNNASHKRKISEETLSERNTRLEKAREHMKTKRQKTEKVLSQKDYFNEFDSIKYGKLHEQSWAKANISKFHNSIEFSV